MSVTNVAARNATACVAFEPIKRTVAKTFVFAFCTINVSVALPRFWNAFSLQRTEELIVFAIFRTVGFVGTINTVIESVALPK